MRALARFTLGFAAAILGVAISAGAFAQAAPASRINVTGSFGATFGAGGDLAVTLACEIASPPAGPCIGTYNARLRDTTCTNTFALADAIEITGMNLSAPGAIEGSVRMVNFDFNDIPLPGGACAINTSTLRDLVIHFTGQWDGTRATITFDTMTDDMGAPIVITGTLLASTAAPVFPMVVTASIAETAVVSAVFQYRPQDVGSSGSVYTFAVAPSTLVLPVPLAKDALPPLGYAKTPDGRKDTAVACVLAQLNASGQLQAVSASSLRAYVSGVLSGQGQAVSIVNGVATASIGGATFYVGYGANAAAMLSGGLNRSAITVPGARECRPQPPQTGWWWNTTQGGRGYSIEVRGNNLFYAGFLYDDAGRATWYVAAGPVSLDGSLFTGNLLRFAGGQTLAGAYRAPGPEQVVGPFTLAFSDNLNGTMAWPGGTVALERFNIVPGGLAAPAQPNVPESGWWWSAAESGRGYFIEWQGGTAFLSGYMYDDAGDPVWYLSSYPTPDPRQFAGNWWLYAGGQSLTGPPANAARVNDNVAPLSIRFDSTTTGTLTLPGNRTVPITRFRF